MTETPDAEKAPATPQTTTPVAEVQDNPIASLSEKIKAAKAEQAPVETTTENPVEKSVEKPVIAETKTEKPVETSTEKPDPMATAKNKLKEKLGLKPAAQPEVVTPPVVQLPKDIEDELHYLRSVAKKPWVELGLAGEKDGKSIEEIIESTRLVNGIDPDRANLEDLFKIKLDRLGIKDENDVEAEMLRFGEKTKSEQIESVMNIRTQLKLERDEMRKGIVQTTDQANQTMKSAFVEATKAYDAVLKESVGKEVLGVVLTPEMAKQVEEISVWAQNGHQPVSPQELFELNFYYKFKEIIRSNYIDNSFAAGVEFLENKSTVTGTERTGLSKPNAPVASGEMTPEQRIRSINKAKELLDKG